VKALSNGVHQLTEIGLLTALITISGAVKLPGLMPGTEFQLSAPLAVAICAVFGFAKYIMAGILSSLLGLVLGTQNLLNVIIALVFRLTVGGVLTIFGTAGPVIVVAGPIGSFTARLLLGGVIGKAAVPLIIAALPGAGYTALAAWPLTIMLNRVKKTAEKRSKNAV